MTLEKADYKHYLQFFIDLAEEDFLDLINRIFEQRNSNLTNGRFLKFLAPLRWNYTARPCLVCRCGHRYQAHALDEDWEDGSCRIFNCECGKFEG